MNEMEAGDFIYTPRFCIVQIKEIFADEATARAFGYNEPTYYEGDCIILGKSLDSYHMVFAAVPSVNIHE